MSICNYKHKSLKENYYMLVSVGLIFFQMVYFSSTFVNSLVSLLYRMDEMDERAPMFVDSSVFVGYNRPFRIKCRYGDIWKAPYGYLLMNRWNIPNKKNLSFSKYPY